MIHVAPAVAEDILQVIRARLLAGGTIEVRTGPMPATTADPDIGDLLVAYAFPLNAIVLTGHNTLHFPGMPFTETAVDTGVAGHARIKDENGVVVLDLTVGEAYAILDTDPGAQTVITTTTHNLGENFPIAIVEGSTTTAILYVRSPTAATFQVATEPGGAPVPVPAAGTLTAAYVRSANTPVSIGAPGAMVTLGDDVVLHSIEFGV